MNKEYIRASDFRESMSDVLSKVKHVNTTYIITRNKKPTAVLLSVDEYAKLIKKGKQ